MPANSTLDISGMTVIASDLRINSDVTGGPTTLAPRILAGTGAPTASASKGSLYIRLDGSSTSTRLYVNTDGGTTWTNFTSAA